VVIGVGVLVTQGVGAQSGERDEQTRSERFVAETAERLGVTPEELTAAMTGARTEMIDEAVAEGKITEDQAAKMKERLAEKGPLAPIKFRHRGGGKFFCHGARLVANAAGEVLGKEPAQVAEAVKAGESLAEQAQAAGMSVEDFKAALVAAIRAQLQTKVDDGTITQEQADRIVGGIEEHIDRIVNFEGRGGRGLCGGGHRGDRTADETAAPEMSPAQ
jgi:polyhydroxyalkanoate synthesis regulator phasin